VCYHAAFGRSVLILKGVVIDRGEPEKLGLAWRRHNNAKLHEGELLTVLLVNSGYMYVVRVRIGPMGRITVWI